MRAIKIYSIVCLAAVRLNMFGQDGIVTNDAVQQAPARAPLDEIVAQTIASLTHEQAAQSNKVVHVRGTVVDQRSGEYVIVHDDTGTIFAKTYSSGLPKTNELVELWGTPVWDGARIYLQNAIVRATNSSTSAVAESTAPLDKPSELPLLTNAFQVRDLSEQRAAWAYPVRLRGVVTVFIGTNRSYYIQDETSGITIAKGELSLKLTPGDVVEVEGVSDPGGFVPVVVAKKVTQVGTAPLPFPRPVTWSELTAGQDSGQWVEIRGIVRSFSQTNGIGQMQLSDFSGTLSINIPDTNAPANLLDSIVRIRGVCTSGSNAKRQLTGIRFWASSFDFVEIERAGLADPLVLPAQGIKTLSQFRPRETLPRRTKIAGIVTIVQSSRSFFVQDAEDAVQVFTRRVVGLTAGDRVEVAGYPAPGDYGNVLRDCVFRVVDHGKVPEPKPLNSGRPLDTQLNGLWVSANARLLDYEQVGRAQEMRLQFGDAIFQARFLSTIEGTVMPQKGSLLKLTGVYHVLADETGVPRSFQLLLPSEKDVQVAELPPRQAFQHTLLVVGILVLVAGLALLWVLLLRRKVGEQTAILKQSETKFRSLVEQSLSGVYVIQDGRFVYVNPRLAEIYGYSMEEMTAAGFNFRETVFVEDWPTVEKQIDRRLNNEATNAHYTFHAKRKDGVLVDLEVMGSRTDFNGRPAILGTVMDITERKLAEAKLAEASNLLDTLLTNIPDFIYFKDKQSRFMHFSKAFAKLFRVSEETPIKGKTDFDFFLEEHARAAYEDEQQIIRTGIPIIDKFETETHADGRLTSALTTKMPWRDNQGNIIGSFGISKDVTALKDTEDKLAYERDLFRAMLDGSPDTIYFKDRQSRLVRFSRSKAERTWTFLKTKYEAAHPDAKPEEMPEHLASLEKFSEWLTGKTDAETYGEEHARTAFDNEQEIIRTGKPVIGAIEQISHPSGTLWSLVTKLPWRDAHGNIIGTFGISRDITDLKRAEAELESAHQRLLETSRLAGMAEVASDVLHNVGNVLNSVNVSCSLTIDRVKTSKVSSLAKTAALLQENRQRLGEFFSNDPRGAQIPGYLTALAEHFTHEQSDLLQELEQLLKHIEHIKQIVAMQQSYAKVAGVIETINPTQLVDDAIQINGAALTRHDVQLHCEFEPVPMIQTEKHRVLQILVNLIRNAKYALDEGKRPDKLLTIKLGNAGDNIQIQVIDNGVGIPPENLTRIFGHGFTTRRNGHGFGLHSSALAIKELGGSLNAHSDGVGKGATFTMHLPLTVSPPSEKISK